jgi:hypothetical protein
MTGSVSHITFDLFGLAGTYLTSTCHPLIAITLCGRFCLEVQFYEEDSSTFNLPIRSVDDAVMHEVVFFIARQWRQGMHQGARLL